MRDHPDVRIGEEYERLLDRQPVRGVVVEIEGKEITLRLQPDLARRIVITRKALALSWYLAGE